MRDDSTTMGMLAHLTALAGGLMGGVGAWVGPLIIWLIKKDNDPFAAEHAKEALNFNITVTILVIAGIIIGFVTLGIGFLVVVPVLLVVGVLWLIWTIQAAMRANDGQPYRYPMTIRLIN